MATKPNQMDLTTGVIWKQLLLFSIPILCSNLFQQLYNTVDAVIVGAFVGSEALAAVGSTGALIALLVGLFMGLSTGASVVVSRFFGAKEDADLERSVHTAMATGLLSGFLLTIIGVALSPVLLRLMKTPDNVIELSTLYLRILFLGMIPNMLYNMGAGILRAIGDSKRPLQYLIVGGVANVILDLVFVIFFHWGVAGAAIATVFAQILAAILVLIQLMTTKEKYRFQLSKLRMNGRIFLYIVKIGIPAGIQSILYAISNLLIQTNVNVFGSAAMAGCAAYGKIDGFIYMPLNAFGIAVTTFTSQNMGAQRYERVKKGAIVGVLLGVITSVVGGAIVLLTAKNILGVFTKNDAQAISYGLTMMWCITPFYWTFSATEVLSGVIRGAGSALVTMLLTAVNICLLRVVMISVGMPIFHDIRLVFIAYPISWILCSTCFLLYYRFGHWMKKTL